MKERFEARKLTGSFSIKCKNDDGTFRMWEGQKEDVVRHIVDIVVRYRRMGYRLTLRQLHYQLVTKNWIINHDTAYKKLGDILDDCRYAGVVDWDAIEDRGRVPHLVYDADGVSEALDELHDYYRRNRQDGQTNVVEVWTEKDALSGILKRPAEKYHVRLVVNKGYTSSSAIYGAYERVLAAIKNDQRFTILYFGDHDPSGLDMVRDIRERLMLFLCQGSQLREDADFMAQLDKDWEDMRRTIYDLLDHGYLKSSTIDAFNDGNVEDEDWDDFVSAKIKRYIETQDIFQVIAIGLTKDQIDQYDLPPNPTKLTDTRAAAYVQKYGRTCWEVDALDPEVLNELIEDNIVDQINIDQYENMLLKEKADKAKLKKFIKDAK